MVVIRLQRRGTKKTPHHRIVVTDRSRAQSGRILESVGYYDPSYDPPLFTLDESRIVFWISSGAKMSEAVSRLFKRFKNVPAPAAATKK